MALSDAFAQIWARLGGGSGGGFDHGVLDVAPAHGKLLGEPMKINVARERRFSRMDLQLPYPHALFYSRHLEQHMAADPTFECRIEIGGQVRGENDDAVEGFELAQKNVNGQITLAVVRQDRARRAPRSDGVRFVEKQDGVLLGSGAKGA